MPLKVQTMKNLSFLIILMLFSCSDNTCVVNTLNKAESLMNEHPCSALRLIETVEPATVKERKNRALYALLYTQASYKNYLLIESDSLIKVALDYYDGRDDKRHSLSLFYLGIYQASIDSTKTSLETFKKAEEIATNPHDLALINFEIGYVYENQHTFEEAVERYKRAVEMFRKANHLKNEGLTYGKIGFAYGMLNKQDSSLIFLNKALDIARTRRDTTEIISSLTMINNSETKFSNDYAVGIQKFKDIFSQYNRGVIPSRYRRDMLRLYYNNNQLDSARSIALECINSGKPKKQSFVLYLALIENAAGNYKQAYDYSTKYTKLSDSLNRVKFDNFAAMIEKRYDNDRLMSINSELRYDRRLWALIAISTTLILIIVFMVYRIRVQRKEREIANSQQFIRNLQLNISQITPLNNENMESAFKLGTDIIRQLLNLSFLHGNNETAFHEKFLTIMSVKSNKKELLNVLVNMIELKNPKLFESLKSKYPSLSETDIIFLGLSLGGFSYQELSVIYQIEYHSVIVRLSRIKKKIGVCSGNILIISDILSQQ